MLGSDHPIDLARYQVANCYMGRIGLINSGGESGKNDLAGAVTTAVINKRAGGMGLISGRKAFQKPKNEGVDILNAIQGEIFLADLDGFGFGRRRDGEKRAAMQKNLWQAATTFDPLDLGENAVFNQ